MNNSVAVATWGGRRPGAGAKPRDLDGRKRVARSITISAASHEAILAAQQAGETYSETLDRLVAAATAALP